MPRAFIPDGLTQAADIKPPPDPDFGEYPPIKITFRPPMPDVLLRYQEVDQLRGPERVDALLAFLAKHLVSWEGVTDDKDKPVELPPDTQKAMQVIAHVPDQYLFLMRNEIEQSVRKLATLRKN